MTKALRFLLIFFSVSYFNINHALAGKTNDTDNIVNFQQLKSQKPYKVNIGTGFFINNNTIITNQHVVHNCKHIIAQGAITSSLVELIANDKENDIAVLKSNIKSKQFIHLRKNSSQIKKNDVLFSIGYPQRNNSEYSVQATKFLGIKDSDQKKEIYFIDNIDHGNSGGPLVDNNANLVGIVTARVTYEFTSNNSIVTYKNLGMAISVDFLIKFLDNLSINYFVSNTYDVVSHYRIDNLFLDSVVNIRCVILENS